MTKIVVGKRGDVLKIECLKDGVTEEGFFLIRDSSGVTVRVNEIVAGDVVFTMDESKRTFSDLGLHYKLFVHIKGMVENKDPSIEIRKIGELGEVKNISMLELQKSFNALEFDGLRFLETRGLSPSSISKVVREIGFRMIRTGAGWVVIVEEKDLLAAGAHFKEGE